MYSIHERVLPSWVAGYEITWFVSFLVTVEPSLALTVISLQVVGRLGSYSFGASTYGITYSKEWIVILLDSGDVTFESKNIVNVKLGPYVYLDVSDKSNLITLFLPAS